MKNIQVKIKFLSEKKLFPKYQTIGSSGMDIFACTEKPIVISAGETTMIPTGFAIAIPEGYEAQIRPRSGLAAKFNIGVINSPGTIDADYRGEVKILLSNFSKNEFIVNPNDRIAQMVIQEVILANWEETENLPKSSRNEGSFGHTGV